LWEAVTGSNGKLKMKRYFHYFDDQRKVQAAKNKITQVTNAKERSRGRRDIANRNRICY
jgi:hypothetical protein